MLDELMERYASGDEAVFEQLYQLMAPRLYRFCLRLARCATEADDLLQETFLKLHRARAAYVPGADALHWAFAIARSVYLTRLRYWRRRPEGLGSASDIAERDDMLSNDGASPEDEALAQDLVDVVAFELGRMSEKNRVAYSLLKEEGLCAKDAAAVLGTTADAVKQRAHRAYEQLRAALDAAGRRNHGNRTT